MATYSFEPLPFDPAPGDPDAVERAARDSARAGRDLQDGAGRLASLGDPGIWEGEAAEGFKNRAHQVRVDLDVSAGACQTVASTLIQYADTLRDAQTQARRAAEEAAEANARAERFATDIERLTTTATTLGPDDPGMADLVEQIQSAQGQQGRAEDDYQAAVRRARAIQEWLEQAGDAAARTIQGIEAPYRRPTEVCFSEPPVGSPTAPKALPRPLTASLTSTPTSCARSPAASRRSPPSPAFCPSSPS